MRSWKKNGWKRAGSNSGWSNLQAELLEWSQEAEKAEGRLEVLKERKAGSNASSMRNEQTLILLRERAVERKQELAKQSKVRRDAGTACCAGKGKRRRRKKSCFGIDGCSRRKKCR